MTSQFGAFTASELYCAKCRQARPVRQKLLLVLPDAELYEYLCTGCGASVGQRSVPVSIPTTPPKPAQRPQQGKRHLLR
jgi:hypothetical protein